MLAIFLDSDLWSWLAVLLGPGLVFSISSILLNAHITIKAVAAAFFIAYSSFSSFLHWFSENSETSLVIEDMFLLVLAVSQVMFFLAISGYFGFNPGEQTDGENSSNVALPYWGKVSELGESGFAFNFYLFEAQKLKTSSAYSLFGVGVVVFVAVGVVLFAGLITSIDLRGSDQILNAQRYSSTLEARLNDLKSERKAALETLNQLELTSAELSRKSELELRKSLLAAEVQDLEQAIISQRSRVETANVAIDRMQLSELRNSTGGARSSDGEENTSNVEAQALIASAVTRFGVIAVLLFFAQALINLYRYSLKMAAHYQANAISVLLSDGNDAKIRAVSEVLSVKDIRFGKEPPAPLTELSKAADVISKLK